MKKTVVILWLLLMFPLLLQAESISIFDVNTDNYPNITAKVLALDNQSKPLKNLVASDLEIFENGKSRFVNSLKCENLEQDTTVSLIISIDASESMSGDRLDLARNAAINLIENVDLFNNEIAIQTFNEQNSINQDFTNQKSKLINAINNITSYGGTNFNAAFLDVPAGSVRIAKRAKYKPIIVVITDGIADGNEGEIIDSVLKTGVIVYSITLGTETPQILKNICDISGGNSFENITNQSNLADIFKVIFSLSQGIEPCEIAWTSADCESIREVECKLRNTNVSNFNYYKLPADKFLGFEFENQNYLEFGIVPIGENPTELITIKAMNQDIRVSSIISNNPSFKIVGFQNGTIFEKDKPIQIGVQFTPQNDEYETAEFTINAGICFGTKFYASGGDKYNIGDKKLKIEFPNGGETILAQSDTIIKWSGLIPADSIELRYSSDEGSNWNLLSSSAFGLRYNWKNIPKIQSEKYLIKAIQFSNEFDKTQIIKILKSKNILHLDWNNNDEKLLIANSSGEISNFNLSNFQDEILFDNINDLQYASINDDESLIAFTEASKIKIFNLNTGVPFGELSYNNEYLSKILFSPDGLYIAAVSSSGNLLIWRLSDRQLFQNIQVDDISCSDYEWFPDSDNIISSGESGSLRIWRVNDKKLINEIINEGDEIRDISLSSNGFNVALLKESNTIEIYDISTKIKVTSFKGFESIINKIEYSPNIDYFLEISNNNKVAIRQTKNINIIWQKYSEIESEITASAWASNSDKFAIGDSSGIIHIVPLSSLPLKKIILQEDISDDFFSVIVPNIRVKNLDFGEQKINTSRDTIVINYIENSTQFDILIDSIFITGSHKSSFTLKNNFVNRLMQANVSLPMEFTFAPKELGLNNAQVNVSANGSIFSSSISGIGLPADTLLVPGIIDFGLLNIGESFDTLAVVLNNVSQQNFTIDSIALIGPDFLQFRFDVPESYNIQPGETKSLNLYFEPINLGRTSTGLAFYINGFSLPVISNLFGEGTAPKIEYDSTIQVNAICYPKDHIFEINYNNSGNGDLIIKDIYLTGKNSSDFNIISEATDYKLIPNQSGNITLSFEKFDVGNYQAELNIGTNLNSDNRSDFVIKIEVRKDSLGAFLDNTVVELINLERNIDYFDTLYITNSGSINLNFTEFAKVGQFEVNSITPQLLLPDSTAQIIIKFNATERDGEYSSILPIISLCEEVIEINAIAYVGINLSEITIIEYPQFKTLNCFTERDTSSVIIKNIGKSPFKIFDFQLTDDNNSFNLNNSANDFILLPEQEFNLYIEFAPKLLVNNSELQIISNAANEPSGITTIYLDGKKLSSEFEIDKNSITFQDVLNNFTDSTEIEISNLGEFNQYFQLSVSTDKFKPELNSLQNIGTSEKQDVNIYFNGGSADILYYDTLIISNQCGEEVAIPLFANVKGYAQVGLRTGEFSAAPGEIISIPIEIFSPENIELPKVERYATTICFNKNLLFPVGNNIGNIIDNLRCIELNELLFSGEIKLTELEFYAMRGDSISTEILLINSVALDTFGINIEERTGLFELELSDSTLIGNTGVLLLEQNFPNPASGITKIKFHAIENGTHKVILLDNLGRMIDVIYENQIEHGDYEFEFNAAKLSQGFYIYKLITPSQTLHRKMLIIK